MNYDIVIAHRVSPALSKTSVGFTTKRDLVCSTTRSLAEALERFDGRIRLIVILDGCPPEYEAVFRRFFPDSGAVRMDFVRTPEIGNQATFAKQIEVLLAAEDADLVYFSEDDYLYAPDAFKAMAKFIRHSGAAFVTPLDHPDRYNQRLEKPRPSAIRVSAHSHWRTVGTSCLTFMTSRDVLLRSHEALETYARGAMDGTMWLGITKEDVFNPAILFRAAIFFLFRVKAGFGAFMPLCAWKSHGACLLTRPRFDLWAPMPTLAVHLSSTSLPLFAEKFMPRFVDLASESVRDLSLRYLNLP